MIDLYNLYDVLEIFLISAIMFIYGILFQNAVVSKRIIDEAKKLAGEEK